MNDSARDLVSALLAIVYAAVILVVGELYILNRTTKLPTMLVAPSSGTHACGAWYRPIRGLRRNSDGALR